MRPGWWLPRAKLRPKHSRIPSIINSSLRKLLTAKVFDTVFVNPAIPRMSQLLIYPAASAWVTSFWNLLIDLFFHPITVLATEQFFNTFVIGGSPINGDQSEGTRDLDSSGWLESWDMMDVSMALFSNEMTWEIPFFNPLFCHSRPQNRLSPIAGGA